jgi:hypothetical protein
MADPITNFLTPATVITYGGASVAVMAVSNTLRTMAKVDSPWVPFVVSVLVTIGGAIYAKPTWDFITVLLILVNSCILFSTSAGIQGTAIYAAKPTNMVKPFAGKPVGWLSPWLKP